MLQYVDLLKRENPAKISVPWKIPCQMLEAQLCLNFLFFVFYKKGNILLVYSSLHKNWTELKFQLDLSILNSHCVCYTVCVCKSIESCICSLSPFQSQTGCMQCSLLRSPSLTMAFVYCMLWLINWIYPHSIKSFFPFILWNSNHDVIVARHTLNLCWHS